MANVFAKIKLPPGADRMSSADFRQFVDNQPQTNQSTGRGAYSQKVLKTLPDHLSASQFNNTSETIPKEHEEQVQLVQWLRYKNIRHFAIPNGDLRAITVARRLQAEGVVPGPSDMVIIPDLGSGLPLVWLEMKRSKGGKLSEPQRLFLEHMTALAGEGYPFESRCAAGFQEARKMLEEIGYGV